MRILTRYILREMITPTLLGFTFYTSIILMQRLFDMAGMIIRRSLSAGAVGKLLLFSLPHIIVLTVPMSLLFGIMIAVGRLSADSEIVAMRALGLSTRTIYRPVFIFSFVVFALNLYLINSVMPRGNQQFVALRAEIMTSSAEKAIKPRIFYDQYPNLMIYVNDVDPATGQWKGVFVADSRADESRDIVQPQPSSMSAPPSQEDASVAALAQHGSGQRIIVARSGNLAVAKESKEVWMNLYGAETHLWDPRRPDRYDHTRNDTQRILLPTSGGDFAVSQLTKSFREMTLGELMQQDRELRRSRDAEDRIARNMARVEIHKKFAIPFACIAFGVLGLPLGITNRRGGKSSGFSLSVLIILFYYVMLNNGEQLAATGRIPPAVGMWSANIILLALGIYLLGRVDRDISSTRADGSLLARAIRALRSKLSRRKPTAAADVDVAQAEEEPGLLSRLDITFPNTLDRYILREFLKVLALVLVSVIALFMIVDYNEIASDIRKHGASLDLILAYYRFQIFYVLNWTLPISVLVGTLVTFGILSKNNEITAIKSGGVSLYRIAVPVLAVSAVISIFAYLILDFVLPYSNQRAAEMKSRIEGKPVTVASEQKLWYLGKGRYIVNFLSYDKVRRELSQVQVFEFHPAEFRMTRRVYARVARWNGSAWAFADGWMRSFTDDGKSTYTPITSPLPLFYPETPEDFASEVKPPDQMTFAQLRRYIATIRDSGYSAEELMVKLYAKTSWPVISMVMVLIALPFAFRMGKRGALYGVGIALILGIFYWMIYAIFTKFGEVGNLPPLLSAWSANILFALAAMYLFLHVET